MGAPLIEVAMTGKGGGGRGWDGGRGGGVKILIFINFTERKAMPKNALKFIDIIIYCTFMNQVIKHHLQVIKEIFTLHWNFSFHFPQFNPSTAANNEERNIYAISICWSISGQKNIKAIFSFYQNKQKYFSLSSYSMRESFFHRAPSWSGRAAFSDKFFVFPIQINSPFIEMLLKKCWCGSFITSFHHQITGSGSAPFFCLSEE